MFRRRARDHEQFVQTRVKTTAITNQKLVALTIGDEDILLTRLEDDTLIAFSAACPHAAADLGGGARHRNRISCPLHDWKFDLRSGQTLWPEDELCRLTHFPTKVVDGIVWVKVAG